MSRYENATEDVIKLASRTIDTYFSDLSNVKIKYLFDTKKSTRNGKIVLGRCQKPNDLTKHFTLSETGDDEGYQYVIILDKLAYDNMEPVDRERLMRHELRHVLVVHDDQAGTTKCKLMPHNIDDFVEEVELNADDPTWAKRIGKMVGLLYKK